jgi:hypothetical protein
MYTELDNINKGDVLECELVLNSNTNKGSFVGKEYWQNFVNFSLVGEMQKPINIEANHSLYNEHMIEKNPAYRPSWVNDITLALGYNSPELAESCLIGYLPWVLELYRDLKAKQELERENNSQP